MLSTTNVEIKSDFQLVVKQIQQEYKARYECMTRYLTIVETRLSVLDEWRIKRIPREKNGKADVLAEITATLPINKSIMLSVYVKTIPFIASKQINDIAQIDLGWMQRIVNYLCIGEVLKDGKQAYKLHI